MMTKQQLTARVEEIIKEAALDGYSLEAFLRRQVIDLAVEYEKANRIVIDDVPETMSARTFRLSFGALTRPVRVVKQDRRNGGYIVEGTWFPDGKKM
jgi:hypothetical protein